MIVSEQRAITALASIVSMRMLGLFMIFPVFALHAQTLPHVTPVLIGLAIGIYGLTQASLQIPFGMLSDRFGRKPIILIGLLIFAFGSVIAASSTSITGIIIGRALQGCGAISSTVLALTADLTREEHRTKAMAFLGVSFGLSFILALVIGPLVYQWIGVSGIFWLTAILAILGVVILQTMVPHPQYFKPSTGSVRLQFKKVLKNSQLLRLDFGILVLHLVLTSLFVVLPLVLVSTEFPIEQHWILYVVVLITSFITMIPFIIIAEKYHYHKQVFVSAIFALICSLVGLNYLHDNFIGIVVMLFLFFTAFNLLESNLPSLISKMVPPESKGTAMGVYSSAQFFGAFLGGVIGGIIHQYYNVETVFAFAATVTIIWFIFALSMKNPRKSTHSRANEQ